MDPCVIISSVLSVCIRIGDRYQSCVRLKEDLRPLASLVDGTAALLRGLTAETLSHEPRGGVCALAPLRLFPLPQHTLPLPYLLPGTPGWHYTCIRQGFELRCRFTHRESRTSAVPTRTAAPVQAAMVELTSETLRSTCDKQAEEPWLQSSNQQVTDMRNSDRL